MRISVVVPAYNEERLIGETLRRIQSANEAFALRNWETELIVCDNNSSDRTAEVARAAGATVVFEPINQIARARNRGAEAASGDWLIFVDADTHPGQPLFDAVADQIKSGRCVAGGSTGSMEGNRAMGRALICLWNAISRSCRLLAGSFIFCEAAVFRKIGGFSNELFASEEIELTKRLKKYARANGKKIVILHGHPVITSARKLHLYTPREYCRFLARTVFSRGKSLRDPRACFIWYDGRR
jgi:glycosyltransferase involved in cell wall biosynthesis